MAPGSFNGKNYGGLHSGCGKKQKKGVYTLNGYRSQRRTHKDFKPGREVVDIKTDYTGIIEEKSSSSPRSLIKVYFPSTGETKYIYNNLLILKEDEEVKDEIEYRDFTKKEIYKYNRYLDKKKNDNMKREQEKKKRREDRLNMRQARKKLREELNKNIKLVGNNEYNLLKSNSNIVNEINKDRYLRIQNLKDKNKFKLSQDKLFIGLNKLTQDGSTEQLCLNISNKYDYLELVKKYMDEKL